VFGRIIFLNQDKSMGLKSPYGVWGGHRPWYAEGCVPPRTSTCGKKKNTSETLLFRVEAPVFSKHIWDALRGPLCGKIAGTFILPSGFTGPWNFLK
jgi:hypothetical protein